MVLKLEKTLKYLFTITLFISLVLALVMIALQVIGLITGNGQLMIQANEWLKQPVIIFIAIFSGVAFIFGYFPNYREKNNG